MAAKTPAQKFAFQMVILAVFILALVQIIVYFHNRPSHNHTHPTHMATSSQSAR